MAATYFLTLPDMPGEAPAIAMRRGNGYALIGTDGFRPDPNAPAVAFASCLSVTHHRANLPARNETDALKAARFAIEDELAQAIDDVHIVLGPKVAAGAARDIYVTTKARMAEWASMLDRLGLPEASIVPELSLVSEAPLLVDLGDRLIADTGQQRYGIDLALPPVAVDALARPDGPPLPVAGRKLAASMSLAASRDVRTPALLELIDLHEAGTPIDLRTGSHGANTRQGLDPRWGVRALAGFAAAASAIWFAGAALEFMTLRRETARLDADARARYAALFPGVPLPADLASDATARLAQGGGAPGLAFLPAMSAVYESVGAVTGARIRSVDYDLQAGTLIVSLGYAAFGDDVAVRRGLEAKGLLARAGDASQNGNEIMSVMTIEVQS